MNSPVQSILYEKCDPCSIIDEGLSYFGENEDAVKESAIKVMGLLLASQQSHKLFDSMKNNDLDLVKSLEHTLFNNNRTFYFEEVHDKEPLDKANILQDLEFFRQGLWTLSNLAYC